jgi:Icc protein
VLAQLSDPHLGADPLHGEARLAAAVATVAALEPAPDAVLVSGDLTDHGSAQEYARVRELLAPLPMPVHVLPGNHDDRAALREHFGLPGAPDDPLQYTAPCADLRLVLCDSTRPGHDGGEVRLAWLERQLGAEPGAPTIVAMHHVPLTIGLPVLDEIGVPQDDTRALGELLARSPQVRRVVAGHVHRTVLGTLGGCGVLACTSTNQQARLKIGSPELAFTQEPPAFALHALLDDELVSHVQPI